SPLFGERDHIAGSSDHSESKWKLFDLESDFAEAHDLADAHPDVVAQLEQLWWAEAGRNQVLPLFEGLPELAHVHTGEYPRPVRAVYRPGGGPIGESRLPALVGGFTITADIEVGAAAPVGTLCAIGDRHGGMSFHLVDGMPGATFVLFGQRSSIRATAPIDSGRHELALRYLGPGSGDLEVSLDGSVVATGKLTLPPFFAGVSTGAGGMHIGRDRGLPIDDDCPSPHRFTGVLHQVVIETGTSSTADATDLQFRAAARAD
ncbi:MAG: hypothetical protein KDB21_14850, partial [Acidimicrobiales bacterium]|nr:hypothetical protein [Acidimicrobiales bacterium]